MQQIPSDAPVGARGLFARASVIAALSVVIAASLISSGVGVQSLLSEGRSLAEALGGSYFGLVTFGPFVAVGLVVVCSLAAALAVLIGFTAAERVRFRAQRTIWARTYTVSVTAVVLAFTASIYTSAPAFLLVVATVPASLYAISLLVFDVIFADRRVAGDA